MDKLFIKERKEKILQFIEEKNMATVEELCDLFQVSEVTIRKDLNDLNNLGLLIRTHGGAVKVKETAFEQSQETKEKERINEKKAIARRAYEDIRDNESLILDAGTTTQELARLICSGNRKNLTVITNAFNIAMELVECDNVELVFTGGNVRSHILSCVGMFGEDMLKSICVDRVFLGSNNLSVEQGLTTPNMQECRMKQCMLNAAKKRYVLVDSGKLRKNSLYCICKVKDLNYIITDEGIGESYKAKIIERGGWMITVDAKEIV